MDADQFSQPPLAVQYLNRDGFVVEILKPAKGVLNRVLYSQSRCPDSRNGRVLIFLSWTALAGIIGVVASRRGRFGLGWFPLALVVSPLITAPFLLVLPRPYFDVQAANEIAGGGAVLAGAKGIGVAALIGGLILIVFFAISLITIVQHGGA